MFNPRTGYAFPQSNLQRRNAWTRQQLMSSYAVRNNVGYVPGEVVAAFGGREANLLKRAAPRTDDDVWSAENVLSFVNRVGTEKDPHALGVKAMVEIAEDLVEIVGSEQHLVRQFRRK